MRLTVSSATGDALVFFDDNELKLVCNFGVAICNSHLPSTVACTATAGEFWKWSETYENEARRIGGVGSLLADLGPGGRNSRIDSWLRDCMPSYCAETSSGFSSSGTQWFRTLRCCRPMLWCSKSRLIRYTRSSFSLLCVARRRGLSCYVGQWLSQILGDDPHPYLGSYYLQSFPDTLWRGSEARTD